MNKATNVAQDLLDWHDNQQTLNFCGGMLFQFQLTDKLQEHLQSVAAKGADSEQQPVIFGAERRHMSQIPNYNKNAEGDNIRLFHGREVRHVPTAAGGMGFVLQLSFAGEDLEGWTAEERAEYDGWKHDVKRTWRKGDRLEKEGFQNAREKYGPDAFSLHHRFYLHRGEAGEVWLAAEDGCEGTPVVAQRR